MDLRRTVVHASSTKLGQAATQDQRRARTRAGNDTTRHDTTRHGRNDGALAMGHARLGAWRRAMPF